MRVIRIVRQLIHGMTHFDYSYKHQLSTHTTTKSVLKQLAFISSKTQIDLLESTTIIEILRRCEVFSTIFYVISIIPALSHYLFGYSHSA